MVKEHAEFEIDFLETYSEDELINELKRIQKIVGERPVTKADIDRYGRAGWTIYFRKFGSVSNALLAANLTPSRRVNVTTGELINAIIELWTKTLEKEGRRPLALDLKKYEVPYSKDTYRRRFGSWKKALVQAYNSVKQPENINVARKIEKVAKQTIREEISLRRRFLVFKRDQFACVLCGRSGIGVKLEVDHKIPLAKGGTNKFENLQTLCFECNRGKRTDFTE